MDPLDAAEEEVAAEAVEDAAEEVVAVALVAAAVEELGTSIEVVI